MRVSIRFCGGCNPRIDRGKIALELQKAFTGMGLDFVFNTSEADFAVFLSGCLSGCALKYNPQDPPYVTVAATTVNGLDVSEETVVPAVLAAVESFRKGRDKAAA
jgi:hypothetical protein